MNTPKPIYRVEFSEEDGRYVGSCRYLPNLSVWGLTFDETLERLHSDVCEELQSLNESESSQLKDIYIDETIEGQFIIEDCTRNDFRTLTEIIRLEGRGGTFEEAMEEFTILLDTLYISYLNVEGVEGSIV